MCSENFTGNKWHMFLWFPDQVNGLPRGHRGPGLGHMASWSCRLLSKEA